MEKLDALQHSVIRLSHPFEATGPVSPTLTHTGSFLLFSLLCLPAIGALIVILLPEWRQEAQKVTALAISLTAFVFSLGLWVLFQQDTPEFQCVVAFHLGSLLPGAPVSGDGKTLPVNFGLDGISLLLIVLTTFLIPICLLLTWDQGSLGQSVSFANDKKVSGTFPRLQNVKLYLASFLFLESLLIAVFTVLDLLLFYVFFESVLIPMYFIIGVWGSRERKIKASYLFFLYTLLGSLFMLLGLLLLYFQTGSTDLQTLYLTEMSLPRQRLLWLAFFFSFAIKVPMVPLHLWLPEAHVEAPTAASVILAGVLLKLGTYGFLRFSLPLFPEASSYFSPVVSLLSVLAILYASLTTLRQVDLKKMIAYSSVAHMGFVTLGLFVATPCTPSPKGGGKEIGLKGWERGWEGGGKAFPDSAQREGWAQYGGGENGLYSSSFLSPLTSSGGGLEGALFLMLSHAVISSGLFLCAGFLYDRHATRLLPYYGGLAQVMPLFSTFFLVFTLGNLSMPTTSHFVGEFFVLTAAYSANTVLGVSATIGMVLSAAYSIWMYNRVVFGPRPKIEYLTTFVDLNRREAMMLLPLFLLVFWMGLYPEPFLQTFHCSIAHIERCGGG